MPNPTDSVKEDSTSDKSQKFPITPLMRVITIGLFHEFLCGEFSLCVSGTALSQPGKTEVSDCSFCFEDQADYCSLDELKATAKWYEHAAYNGSSDEKSYFRHIAWGYVKISDVVNRRAEIFKGGLGYNKQVQELLMSKETSERTSVEQERRVHEHVTVLQGSVYSRMKGRPPYGKTLDAALDITISGDQKNGVGAEAAAFHDANEVQNRAPGALSPPRDKQGTLRARPMRNDDFQAKKSTPALREGSTKQAKKGRSMCFGDSRSTLIVKTRKEKLQKKRARARQRTAWKRAGVNRAYAGIFNVFFKYPTQADGAPLLFASECQEKIEKSPPTTPVGDVSSTWNDDPISLEQMGLKPRVNYLAVRVATLQAVQDVTSALGIAKSKVMVQARTDSNTGGVSQVGVALASKRRIDAPEFHNSSAAVRLVSPERILRAAHSLGGHMSLERINGLSLAHVTLILARGLEVDNLRKICSAAGTALSTPPLCQQPFMSTRRPEICPTYTMPTAQIVSYLGNNFQSNLQEVSTPIGGPSLLPPLGVIDSPGMGRDELGDSIVESDQRILCKDASNPLQIMRSRPAPAYLRNEKLFFQTGPAFAPSVCVAIRNDAGPGKMTSRLDKNGTSDHMADVCSPKISKRSVAKSSIQKVTDDPAGRVVLLKRRNGKRKRASKTLNQREVQASYSRARGRKQPSDDVLLMQSSSALQKTASDPSDAVGILGRLMGENRHSVGDLGRQVEQLHKLKTLRERLLRPLERLFPKIMELSEAHCNGNDLERKKEWENYTSDLGTAIRFLKASKREEFDGRIIDDTALRRLENLVKKTICKYWQFLHKPEEYPDVGWPMNDTWIKKFPDPATKPGGMNLQSSGE